MKKIAIVQDETICKSNNIENAYDEKNIYRLVGESLYLYGLDKDNYQADSWSPFRDIIHKGDTVLIKPNLVKDNNPKGNTACLYTQKEVIKPLIDYTWKALDNEGLIIVGDAPLQGCDFEKLIRESGYSDMIREYQKKGVNIRLVDFRNTKSYVKDGMHYYEKSTGSDNESIMIDLKKNSALDELSEKEIENLRITNYAPSEMQKYHSKGMHMYVVAKAMLEADVIINVPKIKTHRLAGMTAALKNVVGISSDKALLPHHRKGCASEGGDSYAHKSEKMEYAYDLKDRVNELNYANQQDQAKELEKEYLESLLDAKRESHEQYSDGFWYGNDTIWRTIVDLNMILRYADKKGELKDDIQRKILTVADMVVAGEEEGPLSPSPKLCGTIITGEDSVAVDRIASSLMGFDYKLLPMLNNKFLNNKEYKISDCKPAHILSNNQEWNNQSLSYVQENASFSFVPPRGWSEVLGKSKSLIPEIRNCNNLYVFGAGTIGLSTYILLCENGISIKGFLDNDSKKQGEIIIDGIRCYSPGEIDDICACIIAVSSRYYDSIEIQLKNMGITGVYSWAKLYG